MDAVLCPRLLQRDLVFEDVRTVFESFMCMVHMAVAVDVPVEKTLGTSVYLRMYSIVYAMCTSRKSFCTADIYDWFCSAADRYIAGVVAPAVLTAGGGMPERTRQVLLQWRKFCKVANMLNNRIASYLNRYHTTANNLKTIESHWSDTFKAWLRGQGMTEGVLDPIAAPVFAN